MTLISFDPGGCFLERGGIRPDELTALAPRLELARKQVLDEAQLWASGKAPAGLDAGFIELPERLLAGLRTSGSESELAKLHASADRLAAAVDTVVVLGIGGSYMGARAMMETCCHAYYNEVEPAMRRGRPRIYFEGNNVDNDALLDLVRLLESRGDRWGIVVISKSGGTLETAVAFRVLLRELRGTLGSEGGKIAELVVPVTGKSGKLSDLADALECGDRFLVPDGVGGRFSVLSPVGLLPAALLGLDIDKLLTGAKTMNEHFRTAPPHENVVLNYVGVCHLMEERRGCHVRVLATWGKRLEAFGLWYDQLLAESLGKEERGALPLTVVNTRDLHSRHQQHQQGQRDKLLTNLIVERPQSDPVPLGWCDSDEDELNRFADRTVPEVLAAAIKGTNRALGEDKRPTADFRVPRLDEYTLGQLFQMMMLATVVEGRLIGINPYGQPGVQKYKEYMEAELSGKV